MKYINIGIFTDLLAKSLLTNDNYILILNVSKYFN